MIKGLIKGLHHVTSFSGKARNNIRFYNEILGLQFVKKTVNYDSPDTLHLYYGDTVGNPGSVTTFFPFSGISRGKTGNNSVTSTLFSIGPDSLEFWTQRLKTHQVEFRGPFSRFDEEYILFDDFDGIRIELIANAADQRTGCSAAAIPAEHGIKGLYSLALSYASYETTLEFLTKHMNHVLLKSENERIRLYSEENHPGYYVDLISHPSMPNQMPGIGTVHHMAFQTPDEASQEKIRAHLYRAGFHPSPIMDRQYFKSVYFREPGGVLMEIATAGPGFLIDERKNELGENLQLPPWLEEKRDAIEAGLGLD